MLIGEDFEKIEWSINGLELLEPNAFIGDTLLFVLALFLAFKIKSSDRKHPFITNWKLFFITFGTSLFIGGLGHLFFNYWGVEGKYFSWYTSVLAVYFIERAMISIYPKKRIRQSMMNWAMLKFVLAIGGLTLLIFKVDLLSDVSKGLIIPSVNSAVGMIFSLVLLTAHYHRENWGKFTAFQWSVLILLPSALFQFLKVNFAPWFDRNDASHVLLAITFIFYFFGVKKWQEQTA